MTSQWPLEVVVPLQVLLGSAQMQTRPLQSLRGSDGWILTPIGPTTAVPPGLNLNMRVFASGLVSFCFGGLGMLVDCLRSPLVIPVASNHTHAIGIAAKSRAGIVMRVMASARWYSSLP